MNKIVQEIRRSLNQYFLDEQRPVTPDNQCPWETLEQDLDTIINSSTKQELQELLDAIGVELDEVDACEVDPREEPENICFKTGFKNICEIIGFDPETEEP